MKISDALRDRVRELNTASDELSKALAALDQDLAQMGLGVEAWLDLSGGRKLGYCRLGDRGWHLAVEYVSGDVEDLLSGGRILRVEASGRMAELLALLGQRAQEMIESIRQAVAQVRQPRDFEPSSCEDCAPGPIPHPDEIAAAVQRRTEQLKREIEASIAPECVRCGHPRAAHIEHGSGPLRCERCTCAAYQGAL